MSLVYPHPTLHDFLIADEPPYDPYAGDTEIFPTILDSAIAAVDDEDDFDWRDCDNGGV